MTRASSKQVHPTRVDAAELREWLQASTPVRVLDVRTPAEFESVHIPDSYNVPLDTLREHREEIAHHLDADVVLVCRSGARAERAERASSKSYPYDDRRAPATERCDTPTRRSM